MVLCASIAAISTVFGNLALSYGKTVGLAASLTLWLVVAANAVWPSFYGEMFSTRVRFSGLAIGTQIGFVVAGFAPTIVTALGRSPARRLEGDGDLHRSDRPDRLRRCADRSRDGQGAHGPAGHKEPARRTVLAA